jgi:hypothetical protein
MTITGATQEKLVRYRLFHIWKRCRLRKPARRREDASCHVPIPGTDFPMSGLNLPEAGTHF